MVGRGTLDVSYCPLLHEDPPDVQRRGIVSAPQRMAGVALQQAVHEFLDPWCRSYSATPRGCIISAERCSVRVATLRCRKMGRTAALRAPLHGEVLVDQHDPALECEPTTQSSVGRPSVTSSHGQREFRVSKRKHHRIVSPTLALGNQTVDCLLVVEE